MSVGILFSGVRAGSRVTVYLTSGAQIHGVVERIDSDWRYLDLDTSFSSAVNNPPPVNFTRVLIPHVIAVSQTSDLFNRTKEIAP